LKKEGGIGGGGERLHEDRTKALSICPSTLVQERNGSNLFSPGTQCKSAGAAKGGTNANRGDLQSETSADRTRAGNPGTMYRDGGE